MSARPRPDSPEAAYTKRARTSEPTSTPTRQPQQTVSQSSSSTSSWHAIFSDLLYEAVALLLRRPSPIRTSHSDFQLLARLSSVCAAWRRMVYGESSTEQVDFWSSLGTLLVV